MRTYKNNFKILFNVFGDGKKIIHYAVISENDKTYLCVNEWTGHTYSINKNKVWKDLEELKFHRWSIRMHAKPLYFRQRTIRESKKVEYVERYAYEFPEKII